MDATLQGYYDYYFGARENACPYPPDAQGHIDWQDGWEIARAEDENGGPEKGDGDD